MADRKVHFLLHVPKCAGTSVEHHFSKHLGSKFLLAPRWRSPLREVVGNRFPGIEEKANLAKVAVVSGHSLSVSLKRHLSSTQIQESVLLRDPLSYLLSFYNYRWRRFEEGLDCRPPAFETWYAAQRKNPISRFMLNRYFGFGIPALYKMSSAQRLTYLEDRLANFHFVGGIERASELIAGISEELAISSKSNTMNVTKAKRFSSRDISPELKAKILDENALDRALYARWKDRGWSGAPAEAAPRLSRWDQPTYLVGDLRSGIAKRLIRNRREVQAKIHGTACQ